MGECAHEKKTPKRIGNLTAYSRDWVMGILRLDNWKNIGLYQKQKQQLQRNSMYVMMTIFSK